MYDEFRLTMIRELAPSGLDNDVMKCVMDIVDRIEAEYDVTRKENALIPIAMTAQYVLAEYLACKSLQGFSPATISNYRISLSRFLATIKKRLEDVQPNDIRTYLYSYQHERAISNRTLDHLRTTIAGFFHWAMVEGKLERDPSLAIGAIKYTIKPKPSLSQLDLEYVRKALGGPRERAIVETLYSTGCRVSELCSMKKSDVNWNDSTVLVFGKGSKYREVYLNAKAVVALRDYLDLRSDHNDFLFVSERKPHGQLKRAAVEKIVRQISERAMRNTGIKITPHIFRHTNITTALRNGMALQNVSKMAGHAELRTTMGYATIDQESVHHDHSRYVI